MQHWTVRKAADRGRTRIDWLDSQHTFSFGNYYDPAHMGFRVLRVVNDDIVKAGAGFGAHSHANMEIVTWVLKGALEHRDSLGNGSVIRPGDVQVMSAGTGISHSEFNASSTEPVHFYQIWFLPQAQGLRPRYDQKEVNWTIRENRENLECDPWHLVAGPETEALVPLYAKARMKVARLGIGERATAKPGQGRFGWLQIARGAVRSEAGALDAGDGVSILPQGALALEATRDAELLFFELD